MPTCAGGVLPLASVAVVAFIFSTKFSLWGAGTPGIVHSNPPAGVALVTLPAPVLRDDPVGERGVDPPRDGEAPNVVALQLVPAGEPFRASVVLRSGSGHVERSGRVLRAVAIQIPRHLRRRRLCTSRGSRRAQ